jgi:hypothetical protein
MKLSELIKALKEAKTDYGDLPVVAMIDKYGDALSEIDEVNFETDDKFPNGCIHLE